MFTSPADRPGRVIREGDRRMPTFRPLAAALVLAAAAAPLAAQSAMQERLDMAALSRIREEGLTRSHVDSLAGYLTDVIGPRLTASNSMHTAQQWASQTFTSWGLANVRIEPWDSLFGRGWERVSYAGRFLEPYVQPLYAMPLAWSGSTHAPAPARGARAGDPNTVTCPVKVVDLSDTTAFARYSGQLRGACVLVLRGALREIPPEWTPGPRRMDADSIIAMASRPFTPPAPRQPGGPTQANADQAARFRAMQGMQSRIGPWLTEQGIAAYLSASAWAYDLILGAGGPQQRQARDSANFEPFPALVVASEQAGQMVRDLRRGVPVRLELNVQNRFSNPDRREYNVMAEIPGTDLASQVVMIGAHYDSWYGGTGATDNGAGSVVMMEAMRILKTLGMPMRRTVRIGLWTGEEQGLLGSRAWVRQHASEMPNISAYLNVDNGTGRLRGVYAQGNTAVMPVFEQILSPFRDLGIVAMIPNNTGGTDHLSFDAAGVPGFQFIQDPIEYGSRTHHSQADTYERLVMDDLKQAATIVAWSVYTIANRDEMMPRKPAPPQASN
jgi:carboxypeptidase Q